VSLFFITLPRSPLPRPRFTDVDFFAPGDVFCLPQVVGLKPHTAGEEDPFCLAEEEKNPPRVLISLAPPENSTFFVHPSPLLFSQGDLRLSRREIETFFAPSKSFHVLEAKRMKPPLFRRKRGEKGREEDSRRIPNSGKFSKIREIVTEARASSRPKTRTGWPSERLLRVVKSH